MTESKHELLLWLNDLLQFKYSRVEQCGTGVAYCQIMHSIYKDVPLKKVIFDAKNDYDYSNNFRVLRSAFNMHNINKPFNMEQLAKCRLNDNLELLQWIKKHWDAYYPGGGYDAVAQRREAAPKPKIKKLEVNPTNIPTEDYEAHEKGSESLHYDTYKLVSSSDISRPNSAKLSATSATISATAVDHERKIREMAKQIMDLRCVGDTLERERNFYYLKLRDIEVIVLERFQQPTGDMHGVLKDIQHVLYSTEEGFISPKRRVIDGQPPQEQEVRRPSVTLKEVPPIESVILNASTDVNVTVKTVEPTISPSKPDSASLANVSTLVDPDTASTTEVIGTTPQMLNSRSTSDQSDSVDTTTNSANMPTSPSPSERNDRPNSAQSKSIDNSAETSVRTAQELSHMPIAPSHLSTSNPITAPRKPAPSTGASPRAMSPSNVSSVTKTSRPASATTQANVTTTSSRPTSASPLKEVLSIDKNATITATTIVSTTTATTTATNTSRPSSAKSSASRAAAIAALSRPTSASAAKRSPSQLEREKSKTNSAGRAHASSSGSSTPKNRPKSSSGTPKTVASLSAATTTANVLAAGEILAAMDANVPSLYSPESATTNEIEGATGKSLISDANSQDLPLLPKSYYW